MAHTVKDLAEEAKKRMVLLFMCIVGLAYLMSLTSSSVWFNMPGAILVIILVRYISYDLDARRRIGGHGSSSTTNNLGQSQMLLGNATSPSNPKRINWRHKVDSPVVEASIDQLTRHIVSEWITNLWYKKVTPDQDAPEELINIMNDILGEICMRAKNVNLIDLLTRDIVHLVCEHIELFRMIQAHIGKEELSSLSNDERDARLKLTLAADNKLHPALYSAQAEHKVLQHVMDGVMSFTCKPEDLQCKFFRYAARELLACAVMRPVMNLASPKFINERIVSFTLSRRNKDEKHKAFESDTKQSKSSRSRASTDHFSGFPDQSISGVELVQIGPKHKKSPSGEMDGAQTVSLSSIHHESKYFPGLSAGYISQPSQQEDNKVTVASLDKSKSLSKSSDGVETNDINCRTIQAHQSSGGNWAQVLDNVSRRKSQALAPEHFENMWTKGRNYKTKEIETGLSKNVNPRSSSEVHDKKDTVRKQSYDQPGNSVMTNSSTSERHITFPPQIKQSADDLEKSTKDAGTSKQPLHVLLKQTKVEEPFVHHMEVVEDSESSYTSEDDENNTVTGLDTPSVKVWDSKSNRSGSVSHVRHPLENSERDHIKHGSKSQLRYRRPYKSASGRKRARPGQGVDSWQEVERTTFYLGDGRDILNTVHEEAVKIEDQDVESDDQDRIMSGTMTSSSASVACISGTTNSSVRNSQSSHMAATLPYQQLRCKVFGADFVKSGSKTIAVYSISVTDNVNHSWSIKRRFRHFEELHKRLKEFPEYNLHLPPKRFLSSSLDTSFVYERCKLLDKYLKDLLSLSNVADSIEVWDFLSVDSQTYMFSNSLSIIESLSVDLDDKQYGNHFLENFTKKKDEDLHRKQDKSAVRDIDSASNLATIHATEQFRSQARESEQDPFLHNKKKHEGVHISYLASDLEIGQHKDGRHFKISETRKNDTRSDVSVMKDASDIFSTLEGDSSVPSEWTPPNLSIPILNMVDVIFQLQDGGWIRRQAFWVAKQVLQLGMGDAFDDWLIEKIQLLRKGEVIASAVRKIEQILWPDGIFITKHPRRRQTQPTEGNVSVPQNQAKVLSPKGSEIKQIDDKDKPTLSDQQMEEIHRANFVRELMIDNAPAALVGLVGRKEYERCARDLYFFLQSAVCVKQLAYGLLELLLLSAFPELHEIVNSCHTEKGSFELFDKSK